MGRRVAAPRGCTNGLRAARDADQALKSTTVSDERGILADLVLRLSRADRAEAA